MAKALYTTSEAASELGVTAGRIRQMIIDGELTAEKLGRDLLIAAADIKKAKERKTTPGPKPKKLAAKRKSK
jgi:excisionase family DNA binding protein